jgi:hypothetical protein
MNSIYTVLDDAHAIDRDGFAVTGLPTEKPGTSAKPARGARPCTWRPGHPPAHCAHIVFVCNILRLGTRH